LVNENKQLISSSVQASTGHKERTP